MASELATELTRSDIELVIGRLANISLESTLLEKISKQQIVDPQLKELRQTDSLSVPFRFWRI